MNKKSNLLLKISILFIIVFLIGLTIFVYLFKNSTTDDKKEGIINNVGEILFYTHNTNFLETYSNNIITDPVTQIEYSIVNDNVLYGKFFIGSDKKLYVTNDITNRSSLILNEKIKTLYSPNNLIGLTYIYALAENGKLYYIGLENDNISSVSVNEIISPVLFKNFTNLKLNSYLESTDKGVVLLADDDKMYYVPSMIEYIENILNVYGNYIVYPDGVVSNYKGNALIDSNNNNYKVMTIIGANEPIEELEYSPTMIIVTTDNKIIYLINEDSTYEYPIKVDFIVKEEDNIKIIFENKDTIEFNGYSDSKNYPILYDEN